MFTVLYHPCLSCTPLCTAHMLLLYTTGIELYHYQYLPFCQYHLILLQMYLQLHCTMAAFKHCCLNCTVCISTCTSSIDSAGTSFSDSAFFTHFSHCAASSTINILHNKSCTNDTMQEPSLVVELHGTLCSGRNTRGADHCHTTALHCTGNFLWRQWWDGERGETLRSSSVVWMKHILGEILGYNSFHW